MTENLATFKAGYVAVIGLPNAGKSTLLNQLLQYKLSIVSRKPQTTRRNVLGILNREGLQIIFIDTPGILKPRYNLQEVMMKNVRSAIEDADVLVYLIDAAQPGQTPAELKAQLKDVKQPVILGLNKIDLVAKKDLLPMMSEFLKVHPFKCVIPLSAQKADGLDRLLDEIAPVLPLHPPYYPTDFLSDQQEKFFVSEIIREKVFHYYGQEIPYSTHVEIEEFKERGEGKVYIRAAILIERESQKGIIIGKGGQAIKRVGQLARQEIEVFIDRPAFLELFVKVEPDWRKKDAQLRKLGYR